jgi:sugar lactone lactonase YvrE
MARRFAKAVPLRSLVRGRHTALLLMAVAALLLAVACTVAPGIPAASTAPKATVAATASSEKPSASDRRPRPTVTPTPEAHGFTVVASGLVNPRGLAFGPDGTLYVAEAGRGGPRAIELGRKRPHLIGATGQVSMIPPGGQPRQLIANLPSTITAAGEEVGPASLAFLDGTLHLLTAAGGWDVGDAAFTSSIYRVSAAGELTPIFDLSRYNLREPPLSRKRDSRADVPGGMPFGMAAFSGALYITDGNHDSVLLLMPDGQPQRILEFAASDQALTGIAAGQDGALYVTPYVSGSVLRVRLSGEHEQVLGGLALPIGVAFDRAGRLCVLEYVGQVRCFDQQGQAQLVASGLNQPTAMIAGPDGDLYVSNRGHFSVHGEGEIVRVALP